MLDGAIALRAGGFIREISKSMDIEIIKGRVSN